MTSSETIQLIGSAFLLTLGLFAVMIALKIQWWSHYGREALACVGSCIIATVVVRMLVLVDTLTQEQGREVNGMVGAVFLVILLGILVMQRADRRATQRTNNKRGIA